MTRPISDGPCDKPSSISSCGRVAPSHAERLRRLAFPLRAPSRLAAAASICALAAACGGVTTTPATPHDDNPLGLTITESKAIPWKTYSDPTAGFSVAMPGEPEVKHAIMGGGRSDVRRLELKDSDPRTPDYDVVRMTVPDGSNPGKLADAVLKDWKRGARREKRDRHGFEAVEVFGESQDGAAAMSVIALGGYFYILHVEASAALDPDAVERFFDSLRVEMPWRIEMFPEFAFTVSLPAPAVLLPPTPREGLTIRVYHLAWGGDLWFGVTLFDLTDERLRSATVDEILDDGVRGLARTEGARIQKVSPIERRGIRGREVVHVAENGQVFRSRLFVSGHRGVHVSVSSKDRALITQDTATRVLDSMRIEVVR